MNRSARLSRAWTTRGKFVCSSSPSTWWSAPLAVISATFESADCCKQGTTAWAAVHPTFDGWEAVIPCSNTRPDKCTRVNERAAPLLQMSVPQWPRMNHVRPDLQLHCDLGCTGPRRKSSGVIEQRLVRTNLDEHWRKVSEVGVERRYPRIFSVHASGQICIS